MAILYICLLFIKIVFISKCCFYLFNYNSFGLPYGRNCPLQGNTVLIRILHPPDISVQFVQGIASPQRQLRFLVQLLALVTGCQTSAGLRADGEVLLNEIFAPENLPHLTQMTKPAFDPWPAHTEYRTKACHRPCRADVADFAALLQAAQSELKQLQSKCDFLAHEGQTPAAFSPSLLRVAAQDLQQLMGTFSHVYESDLRALCSREPPSFKTGTDIFQRVHQLLLACDTELEMLNELCEASAFISKEIKQLQTRPQYWSQGKKYTLSEQLVEMSRRIRDFLLHLHFSCDLITGSSSSDQSSDLRRL
uniref:HAUS augmin-like complex subunit 7 n=1 Tax=Gouania willdenowi TaxID=441366 RepID=A0A8C5DVI2_GOUWI